MMRRLLLFNLLLVAVIISGVLKLRHTATAFAAEHQVNRIQPDSEKAMPKAADVLAAPPKEEWTDIATRNPFSFDRNDVTLVVTPPSAPQAAQTKRPKPVLFGMFMLGADRVAMLAPGDGANRASRPVRVGESFDGWTLDDIQDKSVTVRWDETKESVVMNDPTAQVARDYLKTTGANGNQSSGNAVSVLGGAAPPAAAPAPPPNPVNTNPPPSSNGRKQIVVHTPFGDKVMDDPSQQ